VIGLNEVLEVTEQGDLPDSAYEMYEGVRVVNMARAKSVLRRELFEWIKTSVVLKQLRIQLVQVAFTQCGRFAVLVERSKLKSFGLRLAVLDPHHQLTTYLLGVSTTLESALLHSAARIKQIEDDMDEYDRTFKHGDVIHVEHLGYSHVAIYDAEREVFYELIGDIDSGKDAVLAEINNAHSAAIQWQRDLKAATEARLQAALAMFRNSSTICTSKATAVVGKITTSLIDGSASITAFSSTTTTVSTQTPMGSSFSSGVTTTSNSIEFNSASSSPDSFSSISATSTIQAVPSLPNLVIQRSSTPTIANDVNSKTTSTTVTENNAQTAFFEKRESSQAQKQSAEPVIPILAPKPVFRRSHSTETLSPKSRRSMLMHSGHVLSSPRSEASDSAFYNENEAYDLASSEQSERSEVEREGEERESFYDVKSHLKEATMHLRQLATSWDDIGLKNLLGEEDSNFLTSADRDESIEPDDMCPAMAFGFPSHSIAEVQATPKDSFMTRDPLLRKRVQYFANALPAHVVIARARSAVGSPGWNPITRNCEHFATWAKTGKTVSTQVFEFGSNAAIVGASTLQVIVTLAFLGLVLVWFVGRFTSGSSLIETIEYSFAWLLKAGVLVSSLVFALGFLIHWGNGTSADFDAWVHERTSLPPSPTSSNPPSPRNVRHTTSALVVEQPVI
jgi:hypothetical protein